MRKTLKRQPPKGSVKFLYYTRFGSFILKIITRRWISRLAGKFLDSRLSRGRIKPYIKKHGVNMDNFIDEKYRSFNAFFTRRIKPELRPFDFSPDAFVSPCDAKLSLFEIKNAEGGGTVFTVKGFTYTVETLLKDSVLAKKFEGGYCFVLRLSVEDYHRYFYIDQGRQQKSVFIKGRLHTVQPSALERRRVFTENCREYTVLETERFGTVAQIEVGAMMVGRIVNNHRGEHSFSRGEEKGRFEFGGSTIILLTQKGRVVPDEEFLTNTAADEETFVKCGERIGSAAE